MDSPRTVNEILDRFSTDVLPHRKPRTQKDYTRHIRLLRATFGPRYGKDITPNDVKAFLSVPAGTPGGTHRNRIVSTFSAAYQAAIEWGWVLYNPCSNVLRNPSKSSTRLVTDEEFEGVRELAKTFRTKGVPLAMDLALYTRQPQGSILRLRWVQVHPTYILFRGQKSDKKIQVFITPKIEAVLAECRALTGRHDHIIMKSQGSVGPYTEEGFRAVWQRLMKRWVDTGNDRFDFRDIHFTAQQRHKEELARKAQAPVAVAAYPQFEQSVRDEAVAMTPHYQVLYCVEQTLRKLINRRLTDAVGSDWWNSGKVPPGVFEEANKLQRREKDTGFTPRSTNMLDYTTLGDLSPILQSNADVFEPAFVSLKAVLRILQNLGNLRGPVAHCCAMSDAEITRLGTAVEDLLRQIK